MSAAERSPNHNVVLRPFRAQHQPELLNVYYGYIQSGTAAFPDQPVEMGFFDFLSQLPDPYPAYTLLDTACGRIVGFCFLSPYHPLPTFRKTANVDYFIAPEYTGQGLGSLCSQRLEEDAAKAGIRHLVADVSSENTGSIAFHQKHGFQECGTLRNIGNKLGRDFGVVHMQKDLSVEQPLPISPQGECC